MISIGSGYGRRAQIETGTSRRLALLGVDNCKAVLECNVGEDGVDRCSLNSFEL